MSLQEFKTILGKLQGRIKQLYFHLKGEPLAHPLLGVFLDEAGMAGFQVILTTNGTLLAERVPDLQGKAFLKRINVSLHALEGEKRMSQLAKILDTVKTLAPDCHISLRLWDSGDSLSDGQTAEFIENVFNRPHGSLTHELSLKNGAMLAPHISVHQAQRFEWPKLTGSDQGETGFCHGLRDQVGILLDGTVVPCCLDADGIIELGNIFENDWETILNSKRATELYSGFSQRRVSEALCRNCQYRSRF